MIQESFWQRIALGQAAWQMFQTAPLFGVGLGNFIARLPAFLTPERFYFLQPVHNIFLLLLTETGLFGLCLVADRGWRIFKKVWSEKNRPLLAAFLAIVFTGLFDHYWLTLAQGQLLLALIVGLALKAKNEKSG